jgi:D-glucosaminate-6-phosphate ammonia-lyase
MRNYRVAKLAVAALLMAAVAFAADVTGTWTASFETQVGPQNYTYTFKVTNGKLTGTAKSNLGEATIENGTVNGDDIAFTENLNYDGMPLQITYKGKISGDEIKFTRVVVEGINEDLVAKRVK